MLKRILTKIRNYFSINHHLDEAVCSYNNITTISDITDNYNIETPNLIKETFKNKVNWKIVNSIDDNILLPLRDMGYNTHLSIYVSRYKNGEINDNNNNIINQLLDKQYIYCTNTEKFGSNTRLDNIHLMEEYYSKNGIFYSISVRSSDNKESYKHLKKILDDIFSKLKYKYNIELLKSIKCDCEEEDPYYYTSASQSFKII